MTIGAVFDKKELFLSSVTLDDPSLGKHELSEVAQSWLRSLARAKALAPRSGTGCRFFLMSLFVRNHTNFARAQKWTHRSQCIPAEIKLRLTISNSESALGSPRGLNRA